MLIEGSVSVAVGEAGHELGTIHAGDTVGEVSLITGEPHSATVTAIEAVRLATLSRDALEELTEAHPRIALVLYRNLAVGLGLKLRRIDRALADWS